MTHNDTELFELCKEVYIQTQWDDTYRIFVNNQIWNKLDFVADKKIQKSNVYIPLYTSDYLLEKLPNSCMVYKHPRGFGAKMALKLNQFADTPLKALLKLTLALHEAGELNHA